MELSSLDSRAVNNLCSLLFSEDAIINNKVSKFTNSKNISLRKLDKRHQNTLLDITVVDSLSKAERRYLELCARLLKCAQRYFLIDIEFGLYDDNCAAILVKNCSKEG